METNYYKVFLVRLATVGLLVRCCLAAEPEANAVVERLLAESGKVKSIQCEIRRETEAEGGSMSFLSRVWYERPDRLKVEMALPEQRRIVADGKGIFKWIEGQDRGVRIPIEDAPPGEMIQVRRVPGTADEQLFRIREYPERALPPSDGFPVRRAYEPPPPHPYTILSLDATGRLARLEFFGSPAATNRLLCTQYEGWREAKPGIWISCLQKTEARGRDGTQVRETLRVNSLIVNEPMAPGTFDAGAQAPGVRFLSPLEAEESIKK
jgi:hypothetical protein